MTDVEIWQALQTIRNALIRSHVEMNSAMDQLEKLAEKIREENIAQEAAKK